MGSRRPLSLIGFFFLFGLQYKPHCTPLCQLPTPCEHLPTVLPSRGCPSSCLGELSLHRGKTRCTGKRIGEGLPSIFLMAATPFESPPDEWWESPHRQPNLQESPGPLARAVSWWALVCNAFMRKRGRCASTWDLPIGFLLVR
jgi:hypothetical protein